MQCKHPLEIQLLCVPERNNILSPAHSLKYVVLTYGLDMLLHKAIKTTATPDGCPIQTRLDRAGK